MSLDAIIKEMSLLLKMIEIVGNIWGIAEPILFFIPVISNFYKRNRNQVSEKQLDPLIEYSVKECIEWIESLRVNKKKGLLSR
ncbi:hypothetical protein CH370_09625 [Leptospira kmetyi]|nr:hypothetical protein CH370_09625 [Leptospira kmetyi]